MLVLKKIFIILITLLSLIHLSILRGNEDKIESINIEFINADKVSNDKRGNLILEGNVSITTNLLEFKFAFFKAIKADLYPISDDNSLSTICLFCIPNLS